MFPDQGCRKIPHTSHCCFCHSGGSNEPDIPTPKLPAICGAVLFQQRFLTAPPIPLPRDRCNRALSRTLSWAAQEEEQQLSVRVSLFQGCVWRKTSEHVHWNAKWGFILSGSTAFWDSSPLILSIPTNKKKQKFSVVHRAGLLGGVYLS